MLSYGILDYIQTTPVLQCHSSLRMSERSVAFTLQSVPYAPPEKQLEVAGVMAMGGALVP